MNPLLLILLAAGISAGVVFWEQQAIVSVRSATAHLAEQLLQTRTALESEQATLGNARAQLQAVEAELQARKQERAAWSAKAPALPTPEQEGRWPESRPYFYLTKKCLPKIRFGERQVLMDPKTGEEIKNAVAHGQYVWVSSQPFDEGGLNPHMAVLLGMSDEEVTAVNDSYASFVQSVRAIEVAQVQRVDPPKRDDEDGCMVVARLPALSAEIQPLVERWEQILEQTLGASRAEILRDNAKRCFDKELDQLGAAPRDFLVNGNNLWVRFQGRFHVHFESPVYNLAFYRSPHQDWRYSHLFGPDAPCELKY